MLRSCGKAAARPQGPVASSREENMRKLVGALAILIWILAYVAVAAVIGDRIAHEHWAWKLLYFPIAGLAWVLPVKPMLRWMHAKDPPKESVDV